MLDISTLKTIPLLIIAVLIAVPLPFVHAQAVGRQLSPFDFQLDESAVDGKRYSYVANGQPAAIIKQGANSSLPIIILPATIKPILVTFHATTGGDQTGQVRIPRGIHVTIEPSSILVKPDKQEKINVVVTVDKDAASAKYALNIVGEWEGENGFVGTSFMLHIGKDYGPDVFPFNFLAAPLEQFRSGIPAKDVMCNADYVLVIKRVGDNPACVKPQTVQKLLQREWGILGKTIKVQNTELSFSYSITGASIEESKMNTQSKSLTISIKSTDNGTLITTIPRVLLDTGKNQRGEGGFHMLADGQEIDFKQIHATITDRTFSIPFLNGTSTIIIIAPEVILQNLNK